MYKGVIRDAEARRLVRKLNRRMGAISVLTGDSLRYSWPAIPLQTIAAVLPLFLLTESDGRWEYWALAIGMWALWGMMEAYNAGLNKRVDALAELLQQQGMLHPKLPPDSVQDA